MKQHSHSHEHHHHSHAQTARPFNRAFLIAIVGNGLFVLCQIAFAVLANSTSLLADAVHNFGDVLGLILSWIANGLLKWSPTDKTTYGLKKTSILAALANGIMLVFTCGIIASEAIYKLFSPSEVHAVSVMIIAGVGILINSSTALFFMKGTDDINIRSAFLHLMYDALISAGVVLSAALLYWTKWLWIDPVMGLLIAVLILKGTWGLFRESFQLIVDGVPREISLTAVRDFLLMQEGVEGIHDLHIWALSTQENALSVHLFMPSKPLNDESRHQLVGLLKEKYSIHHTTIQIETNLTFCDDVCAISI